MNNSNLQKIAVCALILLASGCSFLPSVGPDYERPTDPAVAEWIIDTNGKKLFSTALSDRTAWWKTFNDPVLSELVDKGIKNNLTLGIANDRLLQARAAQLGTIGGFLPSVNGGYSLTRQAQSPRSPIGTFLSNIFDQYQLGFDASWEIDIFGGTRRRYESADAQFEAAKASADDIGVTIAAEIARTYVQYKALQGRLDIAINNANSQKESKDLVQVKFDAGVVSDLDLQQAISLLETTNATIPTLTGQRDAALYRLAVLLGEVPQNFKLPSNAEASKSLVWNSNLSIQQPAEFLRIRPDVRSAERQLASSVAEVGVSMAEIFPSISIAGGMGVQAFNSSELIERNSKYWNFGPQVNVPLFRGGSLVASIKSARRRADEFLKNYELTVLTALEDAQNSLNAYKNSLDRIQSLRIAADSSRKALDLSKDLYNQGLTDFQRVLESQRALFAAEDALLQGEEQTFTSAIMVYKAFAGGLEEVNEEDNKPNNS